LFSIIFLCIHLDSQIITNKAKKKEKQTNKQKKENMEEKGDIKSVCASLGL